MESKYMSGVQFALFFKEQVSSCLDVYMSIKKQIDPLAFEDPLVIPLPQEIATEAPSVMARSKDGSASINISLSRIDLIFNLSANERTFTWNKMTQIFKSFFTELRKNNDFSRFGCTTSYIEIVDEPAKRICDEYLKTEHGNYCNEAMFRLNDPFFNGRDKYNRVTTVQNGSIVIDNISYDVVFTSLDINSDQERKVIGRETVEFILDLSTDATENELI